MGRGRIPSSAHHQVPMELVENFRRVLARTCLANTDSHEAAVEALAELLTMCGVSASQVEYHRIVESRPWM